MEGVLKDFLQSGKKLLADTKTPKAKKDTPKEKEVKKHMLQEASGSQDPHKAFIRKTVKDKPKKSEVVEQLQRFIDQAESAL